MYTSLGTATKVTGVSKSTILRAILLPLIPLAEPFRMILRVLIVLGCPSSRLMRLSRCT